MLIVILDGMDHWELWESSLAIDEKRLDWTTLQRSCLKNISLADFLGLFDFLIRHCWLPKENITATSVHDSKIQ